MSHAALPLAVIAALLSLTALTVTVWSRVAPMPEGPLSPVAVADTQAIDQLRREVTALRELRTPHLTGAAPARVETTNAELDALAARLSKLEQRFDTLFKRAEETGTRRDTAKPQPDPKVEALQKADVATLQTWLGDPARTEEERLQALRMLRGRGEGARSGAAAQAAIQLVQTSTNAAVRADVWRQMHGARDEALVPHLINSLQTDLDNRVREEAAETLDDFKDRPEVVSALRNAVDRDADEGVRRQAEQSMRGGKGK